MQHGMKECKWSKVGIVRLDNRAGPLRYHIILFSVFRLTWFVHPRKLVRIEGDYWTDICLADALCTWLLCL